MEANPSPHPVAIVGLVASVLALVTFFGAWCCFPLGFITPIVLLVGLVSSGVGLFLINGNPQYSGKGLALGGLAASGLTILLYVLSICMWGGFMGLSVLAA